MKTFFTKLHYKKNPTNLERTLLLCLTPASFAYCTAVNLRNFLYKKNILPSYKPTAATISIGNLTTGGTGKTPITAALANYLTKKGFKTAILSRGYGSKLNPKEVNIISDGEKIYYNAEKGGDEPVWLAENCPKTAVLTSSDRVKIAKYAQNVLGCNILILDDGFQHLKLKRDINIAVVDSQKQFGNGKVLPAGPLREPAENISRADKIIVVNKGGSLSEIQGLNFKTYTLCSFLTDYIYEIHSLEKLQNTSQSVLAFSAIGQPEQFYNLIKETGYNLVKTIDFNDHHIYTPDDINLIVQSAKDNNAQIIMTTEKDAVKVKEICDNNIYALKLKSEINIEELIDF